MSSRSARERGKGRKGESRRGFESRAACAPRLWPRARSSAPSQRIDRSAVHAAIRRRLFVRGSIGGPGARSSGHAATQSRLPVAAGVDAVGRLREERHQGLRVPGHASLHCHPARSADAPAGRDARWDARRAHADTRKYARV